MKKIWLIILLLIVTGCNSTLENSIIVPIKYKSILSVVNNELEAKVNKYTIYGKYFNIEGLIEYKDDFDQIDLVLKSKNNELSYKLFYEKIMNLFLLRLMNILMKGLI